VRFLLAAKAAIGADPHYEGVPSRRLPNAPCFVSPARSCFRVARVLHNLAFGDARGSVQGLGTDLYSKD
jgi:hypothetical protein